MEENGKLNKKMLSIWKDQGYKQEAYPLLIGGSICQEGKEKGTGERKKTGMAVGQQQYHHKAKET